MRRPWVFVVFTYGSIQGSHSVNDSVNNGQGNPSVFQRSAEGFTSELRFQVEEDEAATEGVIHHCERAICGVHEAENVDVFGHRKLFLRILRISQGYRVLGSTLVVLDKHH